MNAIRFLWVALGKNVLICRKEQNMKYGSQDIQNILWENAKRDQSVRVNKKYTKDCAKLIMELFSEDDMQIDIREEFLKRGGDPQIIKTHDRLCRLLGFSVLPLTSSAQDVYKWVAGQELLGEKIETFAAWAKSPERIEYIRMYRKDAENIKIDWGRAFIQKSFDRMLASDEGI